jgi:hypothetical protein
MGSMAKLKQQCRNLGLAVAIGVGVNQASATVSYQILNGGLEGFNVTIDTTTYNGALAGGIKIHKTAGDAGVPTDYVTLCTDIQGTLYLGNTYTYNKPTSFGNLNGVNPRWGADNFGKTPGNANPASAYEAIQNAAELYYNHFSVLNGNSVTDKAALQLAVWSALYNTDATGAIVTTGKRFTFSGADSAAVNEANTWLGQLTTATHDGAILYPNPLNQNDGEGEPPQELLMRSQDITPVPEPTTMIAGAFLLLPFGASALRFLRKNRGS